MMPGPWVGPHSLVSGKALVRILSLPVAPPGSLAVSPPLL